jgi:hypothetical protein
MAEESAHRVILVHGTGAGATEPDGEDGTGVSEPEGKKRWWQRGSPFCKEMDKRLRPGAACWPGDGDTAEFHWTGRNRETERLQAGRDLLENWLLPMEREKRSYHLIGHSHGGSVIWAALREAKWRGERLDHLRSWTTIGTPFLHYRPDSFSFWDLAAFALAAVVGARFAWFTIRDLSVHRWVMLLHWLATLFLLSYLGYRIAVVLLAARRVRADARLARAAFDEYQGRWLGLYSPVDEAITALRLSMGKADKVVMRIEKWPGWAAATWVPRVWPPFNYLGTLGYYLWALLYYGVGRPIYNRWVAPEIDRSVSARLANKCQGNDRSGVVLAAVTDGPLPDRDYRPIPRHIDNRLRRKADAQAAVLVRNLREQLGIVSPGKPDMSQVLRIVEGLLQWTELVHTTYYEDRDMLDLLALHIGGKLTDELEPSRRKRLQDLARWRAGIRSKVDEGLARGAPQRGREIKDRIFEARLRRPYWSGLAFVLLPLLLLLLDPRPWYLKLGPEQQTLLGDKEMRSDHPMLQAVHRDDPDALEYFFTKGADKTAHTYRRPTNTLLGEAITYSKKNTVRFLMAQGVPCELPEELARLPLYRAVFDGSWDVAELLLSDLGAKIEDRDAYGDTPLLVAAAAGELRTVQYLLDKGADPNAVNSESKKTALHAVAGSGRRIDWPAKTGIAAALLGRASNKKALLDHQARQRETALHVAASKGEVELVEFLIQQGANAQLKDEDGRTAEDVAVLEETKNLLSGKRN